MPRKYHSFRGQGMVPVPGFNEAGADAPEIPQTGWDAIPWVGSFNEAGADAPEIPYKPPDIITASRSFNEAGADAPEIPGQPGAPISHVHALQ